MKQATFDTELLVALDRHGMLELRDPHLIALVSGAGFNDHDADAGGVRVGGLGGNDVLMFDVFCSGVPVQDSNYRLHYYDKSFEPNIGCHEYAKGDNYACINNNVCDSNIGCI